MLKDDYKDIVDFIDELLKADYLGQSRKWWPKYIFHFTNINNALNILDSGYIYSRGIAIEKGLMQSDNASAEVISNTDAKWANYVRLYFRPRTPTQYANEGFRPIEQRELASHCPVPIFFLFDSKELLSRADVSFSNGNLARTETQYFSDANSFKSLPFELIYHDRWFEPFEKDEIIRTRHAEVMVEEELDLSNLRVIWCRSEAEYQSFIYQLSDEAKAKIKGVKIGSGKKGNLFQRKWLFIDKVNMTRDDITFVINKPEQYCSPFMLKVVIEEKYTGEQYVWEKSKFNINDNNPLTIELNNMLDTYNYVVSLYFEDQLMFANEYLEENELPF